MLCSARELKLSDDHGGLLILDDGAAVGADLREHLQLDDTLFTLKLTPNLGHCLSVYGVARELAAITGAPLKAPTFPPVAPTTTRPCRSRVEAPDLCGRFSGRIVRGVNAARGDARAGWSIGSRAAASARSRRWSTSRTT